MNASAPTRHTDKQAARIIHDLRRARLDPVERRQDQRLQVIAASVLGATLVGLYLADLWGPPLLKLAVLIPGVLGFFFVLWRASKRYKAGYRDFVLRHLADDGTFLFCPKCRAPLGDPADERTLREPPTRCPECGAGPWRLARPEA